MPAAFKILWDICSFSVNRKMRLSCHFVRAEITHLRVRVSEGDIRLPQRCQDEPFNMAVDRCQTGEAVITKGWDRDGSASTALKHRDGTFKRKLGSFPFTPQFYSFLSPPSLPLNPPALPWQPAQLPVGHTPPGPLKQPQHGWHSFLAQSLPCLCMRENSLMFTTHRCTNADLWLLPGSKHDWICSWANK